MARRQVAELAARGRPNVFGLIEAGAPIEFPRAWEGLPDGRPNIVPDLAGLIAWLDPERLLARLDAEIDAAADDANALAPDERLKQEARLRADMLAIERAEEAFIEMARAEGVEIFRRVNVDPRAVLGVV